MNGPAVSQPVQILLHFAQGRTERIPLEPGVWKVGSSPWACDIVLEAAGVEPLHGLLEVRGGIVSFEDHSAPIAAEEGATRAQVVLEPGDSLAIGSVRLTVGSHYIWPSAQRLDSPAGTSQVRAHGEVGLSLGTVGYPRFQRILGDEISPGEAEEAKDRFRGGLWTFTYLLLAWLALVGVKWFLPQAGSIAAWHNDLCSAAGIGVALVGASYCGLPFAGQLMLPLAALFWATSIPSVDWSFIGDATIRRLFLVIPINWLLGWALDCGASVEPNRAWIQGRRWLLLGIGLLLAYGYLMEWNLSDDRIATFEVRSRWISLAASVLVGFWSWLVLPSIEAAGKQPGADVQAVLDAAHVRWGRLVLGQLLALVAGLMPLVMFLSSLGMIERMAWPEDLPDAATNPPIISHRANGDPVAWFWTTRGRYLREQDLKTGDARFYYHYYGSFDQETRASLSQALVVLDKEQSGAKAAAAYERVEQVLASRRVEDGPELANFLARQQGWAEGAKVGPGQVLHLESHATAALNRDGTPRVIYHADQLDLKGVERTDPALSAIGAVANYFYLAFAVIGFTMLWRRGGESPVARWLGLLFIGYSGLLLMEPSGGLLGSMEYELWRESLQSGAFSTLKITLMALLNAVSNTVFAAVALALPFFVVWVELCWPSTQPEEERGLASWLLSVAKIFAAMLVFPFLTFLLGVALLLVVMFVQLIFFGPIDESLNRQATWWLGVAALGSMAIYCAVGAWLRRTTASLSEVPVLGWKPMVMLVSGVLGWALLLLWQLFPWEAEWQANGCVAVGLVMVVVFVTSAISAMLADNFLRLSEARDLSALLATAVLPFALETSDNLVDFVFRDFHLLLHSVHGSTVLSILLVVLVMVPLHNWLEKNFKRWSLGALAALAWEVERLLEELPSLSEKERRARVDAFFKAWQIPSYAFYARAEGNVFQPVVGHHDGQLASLPLSAGLLDFLQDRPHFCDLEHIPFEWSYYFQQFELYRVQQASGGRYLLPLVLGPTVRGLLILPDCAAAEALARDAIAEELSPLGLEIVCRAAPAETQDAEPEVPEPHLELAEGPIEAIPVEEE